MLLAEPDTMGSRRSARRRLPQLLEALAEAELTGRGGAHFPVARKWQAVADAGRPPVVVANGAEGEPWSAKDAALLTRRPHLVLDGLAIAAEALGARDAIVWLATEATAPIHSVHRAILERRAARLPDPMMRIATGAHNYLSGESSAVVNALTTGVSLPRFNYQPAAVSGVDGHPTLIQNVDTLARVALMDQGHADVGSILATIVTTGGMSVVELRPNQVFGDVVPGSPQAVLLGGFGGRWVAWDTARHLQFDHRALRAKGLSLGAGIVGVLPTGACGLRQTSEILRYLADNSARQCGPCLFGLPELADDFDSLARARASRRTVRRLEGRLPLLDRRGACHHPDGAMSLAASALQVFEADVQLHLRKRRCLTSLAVPTLLLQPRASAA